MKVLFVCSANRCRSAMAEAIFRRMVSANHDAENKIEIKSAGTFFRNDGAPAMENAVTVMAERGLDISAHRVQSITGELVDWAELILTMSAAHKQYIETNFVNSQRKVQLLTEYTGAQGDIFDPVTSGIEAYRECAIQLEDLLGKLKQKMTE
jgi:protein-tyrosine-phosphatase